MSLSGGPDGAAPGLRLVDLVRLWSLLLPFLIAGWLSSALANRLEFVFWGVVAAGGMAGLWRHFQGRPARWSASALLGWAALAWAFFAWLLLGHHETFDLAYRAYFSGALGFFWTAPSTYLVVASLLAIVAIVAAVRVR